MPLRTRTMHYRLLQLLRRAAPRQATAAELRVGLPHKTTPTIVLANLNDLAKAGLANRVDINALEPGFNVKRRSKVYKFSITEAGRQFLDSHQLDQNSRVKAK